MKLSIFLLFAFIALNSYGFKFTNRMLNTLYKNKLSLNAAEITMPALSSTMTEGKIVEWLKNEGEHILTEKNILRFLFIFLERKVLCMNKEKMILKSTIARNDLPR